MNENPKYIPLAEGKIHPQTSHSSVRTKHAWERPRDAPEGRFGVRKLCLRFDFDQKSDILRDWLN
jgi:hypothetical protein